MRIGIDIGGMSIKIGLVDENKQIVAKKVIPTPITYIGIYFLEN